MGVSLPLFDKNSTCSGEGCVLTPKGCFPTLRVLLPPLRVVLVFSVTMIKDTSKQTLNCQIEVQFKINEQDQCFLPSQLHEA